MTALVLKCGLGALVVWLIAMLSRSDNFFIAGLVPLFPTFALIAHHIVGSERSAIDLRTTAVFGLWSLVPYAVYLVGVYVFSSRMSLIATLGLATLAWSAVAALMLVAWLKWNGATSPDVPAVGAPRPDASGHQRPDRRAAGRKDARPPR